jgi:hypothetical protein
MYAEMAVHTNDIIIIKPDITPKTYILRLYISQAYKSFSSVDENALVSKLIAFTPLSFGFANKKP